MIEDNGLVLHFGFTGAPPQYAEYPSTEVIETDQAVVVVPIERDVGSPEPRFAVGYPRTVIANLAWPLGDRVVVDLDASPVVVERNPAWTIYPLTVRAFRNGADFAVLEGG